MIHGKQARNTIGARRAIAGASLVWRHSLLTLLSAHLVGRSTAALGALSKQSVRVLACASHRDSV